MAKVFDCLRASPQQINPPGQCSPGGTRPPSNYGERPMKLQARVPPGLWSNPSRCWKLLWSMQALGFFVLGKRKLALALSRKTLAPATDDTLASCIAAYVQAALGRRRAAEDALARLEQGPAGASVPLTHVAAVRHALGQVHEARRLIGDARAAGCPWTGFTWCDPRFSR